MRYLGTVFCEKIDTNVYCFTTEYDDGVIYKGDFDTAYDTFVEENGTPNNLVMINK